MKLPIIFGDVSRPGGGLIFVRRDSVRGLTTAAIVWLTASVGMACGAGLPILAIAVVAGHFIVIFTFPRLAGLLPRSRWTPSILEVSYEDARGSIPTSVGEPSTLARR